MARKQERFKKDSIKKWSAIGLIAAGVAVFALGGLTYWFGAPFFGAQVTVKTGIALVGFAAGAGMFVAGGLNLAKNFVRNKIMKRKNTKLLSKIYKLSHSKSASKTNALTSENITNKSLLKLCSKYAKSSRRLARCKVLPVTGDVNQNLDITDSRRASYIYNRDLYEAKANVKKVGKYKKKLNKIEKFMNTRTSADAESFDSKWTDSYGVINGVKVIDNRTSIGCKDKHTINEFRNLVRDQVFTKDEGAEVRINAACDSDSLVNEYTFSYARTMDFSKIYKATVLLLQEIRTQIEDSIKNGVDVDKNFFDIRIDLIDNKKDQNYANIDENCDIKDLDDLNRSIRYFEDIATKAENRSKDNSGFGLRLTPDKLGKLDNEEIKQKENIEKKIELEAKRKSENYSSVMQRREDNIMELKNIEEEYNAVKKSSPIVVATSYEDAKKLLTFVKVSFDKIANAIKSIEKNNKVIENSKIVLGENATSIIEQDNKDLGKAIKMKTFVENSVANANQKFAEREMYRNISDKFVIIKYDKVRAIKEDKVLKADFKELNEYVTTFEHYQTSIDEVKKLLVDYKGMIEKALDKFQKKYESVKNVKMREFYKQKIEDEKKELSLADTLSKDITSIDMELNTLRVATKKRQEVLLGMKTLDLVEKDIRQTVSKKLEKATELVEVALEERDECTKIISQELNLAQKAAVEGDVAKIDKVIARIDKHLNKVKEKYKIAEKASLAIENYNYSELQIKALSRSALDEKFFDMTRKSATELVLRLGDVNVYIKSKEDSLKEIHNSLEMAKEKYNAILKENRVKKDKERAKKEEYKEKLRSIKLEKQKRLNELEIEKQKLELEKAKKSTQVQNDLQNAQIQKQKALADLEKAKAEAIAIENAERLNRLRSAEEKRKKEFNEKNGLSPDGEIIYRGEEKNSHDISDNLKAFAKFVPENDEKDNTK